MASPFRLFRKYQKTLLVIAGVILMFVFVVGDSLMKYVRHAADGGGNAASRQPGAVAVRWDGGKLTNAELNDLVMQRLVVNGFLGAIVAEGQRAALERGIQPPPLRVEMISGPERPQEGVERDVVRVRIFADAARAVGMDVSDEHLVRYLTELGRGMVTPERIRQIVARLNIGGHSAPIDYVLDAVREELLARNYLASYTFAFDTVLPEERWKDWLRVNDRVVVEAAAIPVETFLAKVPDPTDAELKEFFEQYRNREWMPDRVAGVEMPSPIPGFAIPRKVELQFLRADFDQFLAKVENEVSDEEIEKFYEDNKDPYFIKVDTGLLDGDDATTESSDATSTGDVGQSVTDGDSDSFDAGANSNAAATEDAESAEEAAPVDEGASEQAVDTEPGESDAPSSDAEKSSLNGGAARSPFQLVAFAEGDESDSPAVEATADAAATPSTSAARSTEFQPLEDVKDEIRRQLAQIKVNEQLGEMMGKLETELSASHAKYFSAVLDAEAAEEDPPPPPPDLADLTPLAEQYGLEYTKTEPISFLQLRELPIGASATSEGNAPPFAVYVLSREVELYQPIATFDLDNNRYLAMKTNDTPERVPELDEIRDEVVRAWKMQQAANLALKEAEAQAKEAQASGASLKEVFEGEESVTVTTTDPFSWLTIGSISRQTQQVQSFRLSEPDGLVAADNSVLRTIFELGEGEVGAVLNHDRSIAYVVRVVEHETTVPELRQQFLSEADNWYGLPAMARDHARFAVGVLLSDMLASADIDWVRPPDAIRAATE